MLDTPGLPGVPLVFPLAETVVVTPAAPAPRLIVTVAPTPKVALIGIGVGSRVPVAIAPKLNVVTPSVTESVIGPAAEANRLIWLSVIRWPATPAIVGACAVAAADVVAL